MRVAFDVILQPFSDGQPSVADGAAIRDLLEPYVVAAEEGWARLETADGDADVYGYDDLTRGFMVNHAAGHAIWDVLVEAASVGSLAIMPVGCPACVTDQSRLVDLPSELVDDAVVVSTGRDLLRVIEQA